MEHTHIEWDGLEFNYVDKNRDWYIRIGIVGAILALIAIIFNNFLLAVFIVIAIFVLYVLGTKKPQLLHYSITKSGFLIEDTLYPYDNLHSFWVRETPEGNFLVIKTEAYLTPFLIMSTKDLDVEQIRSCLLEYLDEEEHPERLSERISEFIKF